MRSSGSTGKPAGDPVNGGRTPQPMTRSRSKLFTVSTPGARMHQRSKDSWTYKHVPRSNLALGYAATFRPNPALVSSSSARAEMRRCGHLGRQMHVCCSRWQSCRKSGSIPKAAPSTIARWRHPPKHSMLIAHSGYSVGYPESGPDAHCGRPRFARSRVGIAAAAVAQLASQYHIRSGTASSFDERLLR